MTLAAGCPRCASPVTADPKPNGHGWICPDHGSVTPLWRPVVVGYDTFAEHLLRCGTLPTMMPWPLSPGWAISDFGCVASVGSDAKASFVTCAGSSDLDGVVELTVVSEEPGVGLGARCASLNRTDPGAEIGDGPPHVKIRFDGHPISLWSVLTSETDTSFDRSVFAGEAMGRWLWLVFRPASAALLLNDEWILCDLADLGPELIDVPFRGSPPAW